jgi:hypothetical protein
MPTMTCLNYYRILEDARYDAELNSFSMAPGIHWRRSSPKRSMNC